MSATIISEELPAWKPRGFGCSNLLVHVPGEHPMWSGVGCPPTIGERVVVRMNGCGPGVVVAYAVHEGYLGLMVRLDEETRPDFCRNQNPSNRPSLVFGAELQPSLACLYSLWDSLAELPLDEDGAMASAFRHFPAGTPREHVWEWFERQNPKFVVGDVQRGIRPCD